MIFLCNVFVYQSVYKMSCSIGGYVESKKKDKVFEKKNGDFVSELVFFFFCISEKLLL